MRPCVNSLLLTLIPYKVKIKALLGCSFYRILYLDGIALEGIKDRKPLINLTIYITFYLFNIHYTYSSLLFWDIIVTT